MCVCVVCSLSLLHASHILTQYLVSFLVVCGIPASLPRRMFAEAQIVWGGAGSEWALLPVVYIVVGRRRRGVACSAHTYSRLVVRPFRFHYYLVRKSCRQFLCRIVRSLPFLECRSARL